MTLEDLVLPLVHVHPKNKLITQSINQSINNNNNNNNNNSNNNNNNNNNNSDDKDDHDDDGGGGGNGDENWKFKTAG